MTDMRVFQGVRYPGRSTADGNWRGLRGLRDGAAVTANYFDVLGMEGRIYIASMGSVTTPLTFLASAANRPDAWIRVPSGTTILPIMVNVTLEAAAGTLNEIDVRICQNDIGNGTSSAATAGPIGARTDAVLTSNCTARQLATADTTAETNPISLLRRTYARADEAGIEWRGLAATRAELSYPVLVGPATLEVFIAATTTQATGFVVMTWAELPSTDLT